MSEHERGRRDLRESDLNAFLRRNEEANADLRGLVIQMVDGLGDRLGRIELDVAKGNADRAHLANELGELRSLLAEGREQVDKLAKRMEANAALDRGARALAATSFAVWIGRLLSMTKFQKTGAVAATFLAIAWTADKGPAIVRLLNKAAHAVASFWVGMGK